MAALVAQIPSRLKTIKPQTKHICLQAILASPYAIQYVDPMADYYEELVLMVMAKRGDLIRFVQNPSHEIKLAAIKQSKHAIRHIKDPCAEVLQAVAYYHPDMFEYLQSLGQDINQLIQTNHRIILEIPARQLTSELTQLALRLSGEPACRRRFDFSPRNLSWIYKRWPDEAFLQYIVKYDLRTLHHLKMSDIQYAGFTGLDLTNQSLETAVIEKLKTSKEFIRCVPKKYFRDKILQMIMTDVTFLHHIKDTSKYKEIAIAMLEQNGLLLGKMPWTTYDMVLVAIQQNGLALRYTNLKSNKICLMAVKQNGLALEYVYDQTREICLAAVEQHGLALNYVREQTIEICSAAIKQNKSATIYVNNEMAKVLGINNQEPIAWVCYMPHRSSRATQIRKLEPKHIESQIILY